MSPFADPKRWKRVERLVDEGLDCDEEQRSEFLHRMGEDDPDLASEVATLLKECEALDDFLERPAMDDAAQALAGLVEELALDPMPDLRGRRLGVYRLVERIGSGGMGVVYCAERDDEQYQQQVALKLLPAALSSTSAVRRFQTERQILAQLEHPNVARLLDGGVSDDGLLYLVMELIDGVSLDDYCERTEPSLEQRLDIFLAVCDAVSYAHGQLVVHRDLKPGNILVTADGTPKLLDFGIGKLLEEAPSHLTITGMGPLTPGYASPEQLRGEPAATHSDVFSLGIILYQLLTDRHPFYDDGKSSTLLVRAVLEDEPSRPSEVVPTNRKRPLRGDLDTIVLAALRKDPERRYGSVDQLADDLRRHLAGLPVRMAADNARYRAAKFVRRHRVGVAAAALVAASLIAGLTGTIWQARQARLERDSARTEELKARRTAELLAGMFEAADPNRTGGRELTARELLELGLESLDPALAEEPEVRADLLQAIGGAEAALGELESAEAHLQEVVDQRRSDPDGEAELATALVDLGAVLYERGDYEGSRAAYAEALSLSSAVFGHNSLESAEALHGLGAVAQATGDFDRAAGDFAAVLETRRQHLDPPHPELASAMQSMASNLGTRDRPEEALAMYREALAMWRQLGDSALYQQAVAENDLGIRLHALGRLEEAVTAYRSSLAAVEGLYEPGHSGSAIQLTNLGKGLMDLGHFTEAEPVVRRAAEIYRSNRTPESFERIAAEINLGTLLVGLGHLSEGADTYQQAVTQLEKTVGTDHQYVGLVLGYLGYARLRAGDANGAGGALARAASILDNPEAATDARASVYLLATACLEREAGNLNRAKALLEQTIAIRAAASDEGWSAAEAEVELAETLRQMGRTAEAAELIHRGHQRLASSRGDDDWLTRRSASYINRLQS